MELDWDQDNIAHLARHTVTPDEFEEALRNDPLFLRVDDEGGEERWSVLGATNGLQVLYLVITYRGHQVRPVTGGMPERACENFTSSNENGK